MDRVAHGLSLGTKTRKPENFGKQNSGIMIHRLLKIAQRHGNKQTNKLDMNMSGQLPAISEFPSPSSSS
jgi:hypothetical protein